MSLERRARNLFVALAACCLSATPTIADAVALRAGAGRAEIAIPPGTLPIDGFTVQHDPLQARVLMFDDGRQRVAIAAVELTSIFDDTVVEMKRLVSTATGIAPANVWIVAGHSFSAPHLFGNPAPPGVTQSADEQRRARAYQAAVLGAVSRAAAQAKQALRPARFGFGEGVASVNVNRNVEGARGWWLGASDAGPSDKSVGVLCVDALDGRPLAMLVDYTVQSSVMDHVIGRDGGKGITPDLGGTAVRHVERAYGDATVALFLTGAAGDQAPALAGRRNVYDKDGNFHEVSIGEAGYKLVDLLGERLGAEVLRVAARTSTTAREPTIAVAQGSVQLAAQERPRDLQRIQPTRSYTYPVKGEASAPYFLIRLGDVALVGVQVELSAAAGMDIKRRSPFAHTMVVTMVNGAAKYLPDADGYRKFTYEAMNSSYAPGSAERLETEILDGLAALHAKPTR